MRTDMDQKQKKKHPVRGKRFGAAGVLLPFFVILLCVAQVLIFSGCGKSAEGPVKAGKTAEQAAGQAESDTVSVDNGSVTVDFTFHVINLVGSMLIILIISKMMMVMMYLFLLN